MAKMIEIKSVNESISSILEVYKNTHNKPVFLTGAGVSVSAGIPLWEDVKKDLYKDLFDIEDPIRVEKDFLYEKFESEEWLVNNVLFENEKSEVISIEKETKKLPTAISDYIKGLQRTKSFPPELILSFYRKKYGFLELQNFLARHYGEYKESLSYISLIKLVELDFLKYYITLNQDGVFEKCLNKLFPSVRYLSLNSEPDFKLVLDELEGKQKDELKFIEAKRIIIGNLHGVYYEPLTLQISPKLLISPLYQESYFYKFLDVALNSTNVLIIIGYKGADVDISGALENVIEKISTNKSEFKVIWLKRSKEAPPLLKSKKLGDIDKWQIIGEADEFLSQLAISLIKETEKNTNLLINDIPFPRQFNNAVNIRCSAPGSLIIAGDYGVYIDGKMIQLQIPLRAYAERVSKKDEEDKAFYFDPYLGTWEKDQKGQDYINKTRNMIKRLREGDWGIFEGVKDKKNNNILPGDIPKPIEDMLNKVKKKLNTEFKEPLEDFPIHAYTQFPTGSGCGDTLPYVILSAMLLSSSKGEIILEQTSNMIKEFLVLLSKLWTWLYTYPNASHLRILPTFWAKSPVFILDRSAEQVNAFKFLEIKNNEDNRNLNSEAFMQANLLINTYSILDNGKEMHFNPSLIDFAIVYYPRRIILTKDIPAKTATQVGVFEIDYRRDKLLLEVMANFTDEIERIEDFSEKAKINRIGKIMSACHFGFVSLGRGSRLVNELVGVLNGLRGIYGAKTSGGGPAGALLVAYDPEEINLKKLQGILETYQHKIMCYNFLSEYKKL